jgi:serine protease AprX
MGSPCCGDFDTYDAIQPAAVVWVSRTPSEEEPTVDMAIEAAGRGAVAHTDGSGWTKCARTLVIGTLAAATMLSGTALATSAAAAGASRPEQVIVRGQAGCAASVATTIASLGGKVTRSLGILDGAAATVGSDRLSALRAAPCVAAVTPDGSVTLSSIGGYDPTGDVGSLYNTEQIIGAQAAWKGGHTGQNVGIALIDTGVSPVQGLAAPGKIVNGPDLSFDSQTPALTYLDEVGHGTHMAGIIAGRDQPNPSGNYVGDTTDFIGVAPDAHIVNVKVADEQGAVDVSQVLAGIDWVVQHRNSNNLNIRIINLSFGTNSTQSYLLDPLAFAAEVAWKSGIVVVASAGNNGAGSSGLNDPAYDPFLIAVGAADTQGSLSTANHTVAAFSSNGTGSRVPDLVAPGVHIESLRDPGSQIDLNYGSTATVGSRFFLGSGTSQAAAVVSGAAALVLGQHPDWNPDDVKYALTESATWLRNQSWYAQGNGELNVAEALQIKVKHGHYTQHNLPATGLGSLDASRGGVDVTSSGVALTGEQDIMGNTFNSAAMALAELTQSSWNGGTWNGAGWAGAGWAGAGWAGTTWAGAGWAGAGWAGAGWAGSTWTGAGWAGAGWAGAGWAGAGWAGAGWAGAGWAGAGWAGAGWADDSWS